MHREHDKELKSLKRREDIEYIKERDDIKRALGNWKCDCINKI